LYVTANSAVAASVAIGQGRRATSDAALATRSDEPSRSSGRSSLVPNLTEPISSAAATPIASATSNSSARDRRVRGQAFMRTT
jgi:hypothetical protein